MFGRRKTKTDDGPMSEMSGLLKNFPLNYIVAFWAEQHGILLEELEDNYYTLVRLPAYGHPGDIQIRLKELADQIIGRREPAVDEAILRAKAHFYQGQSVSLNVDGAEQVVQYG